MKDSVLEARVDPMTPQDLHRHQLPVEAIPAKLGIDFRLCGNKRLL
jgi:hypothetical protein